MCVRKRVSGDETSRVDDGGRQIAAIKCVQWSMALMLMLLIQNYTMGTRGAIRNRLPVKGQEASAGLSLDCYLPPIINGNSDNAHWK